jgi:hypothetical protein
MPLIEPVIVTAFCRFGDPPPRNHQAKARRLSLERRKWM